LQWKTLELCNIAYYLPKKYDNQQIAILFGPERTGLTNQQLACCDYYLTISCNPDYASLNLAACVQIVCYELHKASLTPHTRPEQPRQEPLADHHQLELLFQQLQTIMTATDFIQTDEPKKLMLRLRRLFMRRQLTVSELHLLRGIFKSIEQSL
jgi:tRNA (cytidine32/uridine32-2'-O)-methyltransferase